MTVKQGGATDNSMLGRAFSIIHAFCGADPTLSLAELSRRTNIPKATVFRIAGDLADRRVLERVESGFRLGMHLFELGEMVPRQRRLRDAALPFLEDLYELTHEIVHLGVLEGHEVLYIEKLSGHRGVKTPSRIGGRFPAYCSALGKAILAYSPHAEVERVMAAGMRPRTPYTITSRASLVAQLHKAAREGVAFELEESAIGLTCVASPIFASAGLPVAALSVTGPTYRFDAEQKAVAVRMAALSVTRSLGGRAPR